MATVTCFTIRGLIIKTFLYMRTNGRNAVSANFGLGLLLFCGISAVPSGADAKQDETLHVFAAKSGEYSGPRAGLIEGPTGVLYGAWTGSTNPKQSHGQVFSLTPPPHGKHLWAYAVLHNFKGNDDGRRPYSGVVLDSSGALYGTTSSSGGRLSGPSQVFKLTPPAAGQTAWTETVLYTFPSEVDPYGALLLSPDGALYGTAALGGSASKGQVFELTPSKGANAGWTETTLYSFQGGVDGASPQSALIQDSSGALYGTTVQGGGGTGPTCQKMGCGTVFRLTPPSAGGAAWNESLLYIFSGGTDGANPQDSLVLSSTGTFYGTTVSGGTGQGVVFALSPPPAGQTSWVEVPIETFPFTGVVGGDPYSGLVLSVNGFLFGTTSAGGGANGVCCGTVFQLQPPPGGQTAWTITTLAVLPGPQDELPEGNLLLDAAGNLYGTTVFGGKANGGTVFEIKSK